VLLHSPKAAKITASISGGKSKRTKVVLDKMSLESKDGLKFREPDLATLLNRWN
jgi:hypothetical protein